MNSAFGARISRDNSTYQTKEAFQPNITFSFCANLRTILQPLFWQ